MGQYDKLCKIDIAAARKEILQSISECRRHALLAALVEDFFKKLDPAKKVNARVADKLQVLLQEGAPDLKVYRVTVVHSKVFDTGAPIVQFIIRMYDAQTDERSFMLLKKEDGTYDIDYAMMADRKWTAHADFLEAKLPRFAYNANKFNDMVHALQNMSEEASMPGDPFPVYPLSKFYHWYQLHV